MRPIAVHGGDIMCAHAGRVSATTPLLFLHGWTLDHRMWTPQTLAFSAAHTVLCPDRRGFGTSSAPPDLAREAEDMVALLDRFAVPAAVIIGMSQAGRVAIDLALRFPERVRALVLQGAPASGVSPGPAPEETIPIVEYALFARSRRLDEMKSLWRKHPLMATHSALAAETAAAMLADYQGRDLGAASYLRDSEPKDLARIDVPALAVTGALDTPWRRRAADAFARTLPKAERAEIADAGHLCNLDQPEAYNALLADFLARAGL